MIFEGNYKYDTIENVSEELVDAFVEYYNTTNGKSNGKDYREKIEKVLNNTKIIPYHTKDAVLRYYDKYILRYKDEIMHKFCQKFKGFFKPSKELESMLFDKSGLSNSNFCISLLGDEDIESDPLFTEESKKKICRYRNKMYSLLGITGTKEEKFEMLQDFKKIFDRIVKLVEYEHPCQVFSDVDKIEINEKELVRRFLSEVDKAGFKVKDYDKDIVNDPHFNMNDLYKLVSNKILFRNDLMFGGYIDSFTSESNDILKFGSRIDKDGVILNRLLYLMGFRSTKLEYMDEDAIWDLEDDIATAKEMGKPLDKDVEHLLYKEYDAQRRKKGVENKVIKDISQKEFEKAYRTGQFVPEDLANTISSIRQEYSTLTCENTEFLKSGISDSEFENFTLQRYINNNINNPEVCVYLNEDYMANPDYFYRILIHELNHAVSYRDPLEINTTTFKTKNSLEISGFKKKKLIIDDSKFWVTDTTNILEYANEKQTKEIYEIFKRKLKENKKEIRPDKVLNKKDYEMDCLYDYYGVVLDDFYNGYKDELKENNLEEGENLYFKYDLPTNVAQNIIEYLLAKFNRTFNKKNYYKKGVVDIFKVQELNALAEEIGRLSTLVGKDKKQDFLNYNLSMFENPEDANRCRELIEKSQRIVEEINKDSKKAEYYRLLDKKHIEKRENKAFEKLHKDKELER